MNTEATYHTVHRAFDSACAESVAASAMLRQKWTPAAVERCRAAQLLVQERADAMRKAWAGESYPGSSHAWYPGCGHA